MSKGLFTREYLASLGFQARTIVDIGVRKGTPELYAAFPDRDFILVDPQRGGETLMLNKPNTYKFINKGLGSTTGTLSLSESAAMSTFLERTALTTVPIKDRYDVEVTTLDHLIETIPVQSPIGLKIDTEGYEMEVLKGLQKKQHWARIEFIICEASVRQRFEASYQFSELVAYLQARKFYFFNILNDTVKSPRFYDVLFVRADSQLLK